MSEIQYWINKLGLIPHPEGGYYKETYKSNEFIGMEGLPERFQSPRAFLTSIYYLLENSDFSRFHRLKSDEIWYYHAGNPVKAHIIPENGNYIEKMLGPNPEKNQAFQLIIPQKSWFAVNVIPGNYNFALLGCAVAPGFEFEDFELARQGELLKKYPEHSEIIKKFS